MSQCVEFKFFEINTVKLNVRTNRRKKRNGMLSEGFKSFERLHKLGQGVEIHIQRARAQVVASQGVGSPKVVVQGMVMINELTPIGIIILAESTFAMDQPVTLNIPDLQNFFVKGKVTASQEVAMSHGILRKYPYKFRVQIRFEFGDEAEREAVRAYCEALQKQYTHRSAA